MFSFMYWLIYFRGIPEFKGLSESQIKNCSEEASRKKEEYLNIDTEEAFIEYLNEMLRLANRCLKNVEAYRKYLKKSGREYLKYRNIGTEEAYIKYVDENARAHQRFLDARMKKTEKPTEKPYEKPNNNSGRTKIEYLKRQIRSVIPIFLIFLLFLFFFYLLYSLIVIYILRNGLLKSCARIVI